MEYVLSLDVGTTGLKTLLLQPDGGVVASANNEYPIIQKKAGWAEQAPALWWEAAVAGIGKVLCESKVTAGDIKGVGVAGQFQSLVMLDNAGAVIRDSILWCDLRGEEMLAEMERRAGAERLVEITANPPLVGCTASALLWVKKYEPENFARCAHIMLPHEYLRWRLTGQFATDVTAASSMQLLDVSGRRWSEELFQKFEISPTLVGPLHECCEVVGRVTPAAESQTGLAAGTPVAAGGGDSVVSSIGTGVVRPGECFVSLGTSGIISTNTAGIHVDQKGRVNTYCSAVPGMWTVITCTITAGLALRWLRDTCCSPEVEEAGRRGVDPYAVMDDLAKEIPPGAGRLLFLPYQMGDRTPHLDPNARGVFFGLSTVHARAHLIRAVLEGVGFSLYESIEIYGELGIQLSDVVLCGGGAKSRLWRGILADIFGRDVHTAQSDGGAAMGAAILAAVGAGLYSDVAEASAAMVRRGPPERYDRAHHEDYQKCMPLYRQLYPQLQGSFADLQKLEIQNP